MLSTELCGANWGSSPTISVPRVAMVAAAPVGAWPRIAVKRWVAVFVVCAAGWPPQPATAASGGQQHDDRGGQTETR